MDILCVFWLFLHLLIRTHSEDEVVQCKLHTNNKQFFLSLYPILRTLFNLIYIIMITAGKLMMGLIFLLQLLNSKTANVNPLTSQTRCTLHVGLC